MLDKIRNSTQNIFVRVLLITIALSFVIWGIGDLMRGRNGMDVVQFEDIAPVTRQEFWKAKQSQIKRLQQAGVKVEEMSQRISQVVLQQLVSERIMQKLASDYNLDFSDDLIAREIINSPAFQNESGAFDKHLFQTALLNAGLTEKEYVKILKENMAKQVILHSFSFRDIPKPLLATLSSFLNETRTVDIAMVKADDPSYSQPKLATNEELESFYQEHKAEFTTPEMRDVAMIAVNASTLKKDEVSDIKAKGYYEDNKDEFVTPKLYTFYDLVFSNYEEASKALVKLNYGKVSELKANIKKVTKREAKDALISDLSKDALPEELLSSLDKSKKGKWSDIVKSGNNYHLLYKIKSTARSLVKFEQAKGGIKEIITQQYLVNKVADLERKIEDSIAAGDSLVEIAHAHGLKLRKMENSTQDGSKYMDIAFSLEEGEVSDLIGAENNGLGFSVMEINKITPESLREFPKVKSQVKELWNKYYFAAKNYEMMQELSGKAKKGSFAALMNKRKIKLIKSKTISRSGASKNKYDLPTEVVTAAFTTDIKGTSEVVLANGNYYIISVTKQGQIKGKDKVSDAEILKNSPDLYENALQELMMHMQQNSNIKVNSSLVE